MRRWLVLLMVVLLPLRGLVGEAMAAQMLQPLTATVATHEDGATHDARASAHANGHDCDHHGSPAVGADPADKASASGEAPGDCPTCASCQMCSSVAVTPFVASALAERLSQAPPQLVQLSYRSAEPAHAFKPPRG